jgi:hypothetical protein
VEDVDKLRLMISWLKENKLKHIPADLEKVADNLECCKNRIKIALKLLISCKIDLAGKGYEKLIKDIDNFIELNREKE